MPVTGNFPVEHFAASKVERCGDVLRLINTSHGMKTTVEISLPDMDSPAELWKITIENQTEKSRHLKALASMCLEAKRPILLLYS